MISLFSAYALGRLATSKSVNNGRSSLKQHTFSFFIYPEKQQQQKLVMIYDVFISRNIRRCVNSDQECHVL